MLWVLHDADGEHTCQTAYTAYTYGKLYAPPAAQRRPSPRRRPRLCRQHSSSTYRTMDMTPGIACGIDIKMVESLPVVADYWSDAFYSATFTPAEIAYCLLQDRPLVHLAARWCAKKALQKCDLAYLQADLRMLEVRLSASGAPYLCAVVDGHSTPLPFAVSLSHTTQAAVAVVVKIPTMPDARSPNLAAVTELHLLTPFAHG